MTTTYRDFLKQVRNNMLVETDARLANIVDPVEIARWELYRQQLRTFFDDKPEGYDFLNFSWPDNPDNIDSLKEKAREGDTEAIEILKRKGL